MDAQRQPVKLLPRGSDMKGIPVVFRPQSVAYRIDRVEILNDPDRWYVEDITIGNRSQFMQPGGFPGRIFAKGSESYFHFETAQTAMDIIFYVRYVGPEPEGEVFEALLTGTEAR